MTAPLGADRSSAPTAIPRVAPPVNVPLMAIFLPWCADIEVSGTAVDVSALARLVEYRERTDPVLAEGRCDRGERRALLHPAHVDGQHVFDEGVHSSSASSSSSSSSSRVSTTLSAPLAAASAKTS